MKKIIMLFLSFGVIVFSFFMPKLLFQVEDLAKEKEIYSREKVKSKLDVEAEKIYLVKAIHELYDNTIINIVETNDEGSNKKNVNTSKYKRVLTNKEDLSKNNEDINKVNEEIKKMENINILKDINVYDNAKYSIRYYGTNYSTFRNDQSIKNIDIIFSDYSMEFELENKTGKIIMMSIPKNKIKNDVEKKELLESYIKYLDLYIIDDWEFKNQITNTSMKCDYLVSQKSQLLSMILETDEEYIMSLQTIERYENLFAEIERNNSDTN